MSTLYRFEDCEFEPASGELRQTGRDPVRIQPQPAQLLELLLERAGEVVTREDIVGSVWSDTKVEFDQAVNYAIRHLRIALRESAAESRYIETLPRRGYRFMVPVVKVGAEQVPLRPSRRRFYWAGAAVIVAFILGMWGMRGESSSTVLPSIDETPSQVLAVIVLRHSAEDGQAAAAARRIAERLTARLTQLAGTQGGILGPRTTDDFRSQPNVVSRLRTEADVDFILSGSVVPDEEDGLFFELIRTSDGVHVWAMTTNPATPDIVAAVSDTVAGRMNWSSANRP